MKNYIQMKNAFVVKIAVPQLLVDSEKKFDHVIFIIVLKGFVGKLVTLICSHE